MRSEAKEGDGAPKGLSDCVLSSWKDLRPALEIGAAAEGYVAAIELVAKEPTKVSLKLANPRGGEEVELSDENAERLMKRELATLAQEGTTQRAARRAAIVPSDNRSVNDDAIACYLRHEMSLST